MRSDHSFHFQEVSMFLFGVLLGALAVSIIFLYRLYGNMGSASLLYPYSSTKIYETYQDPGINKFADPGINRYADPGINMEDPGINKVTYPE